MFVLLILLLLNKCSLYDANIHCLSGNSVHRWNAHPEERSKSVSEVDCQSGVKYCIKTFDYHNRINDHSNSVIYSCDDERTCSKEGCTNKTIKSKWQNDLVAECCCKGTNCNREEATLKILRKEDKTLIPETESTSGELLTVTSALVPDIITTKTTATPSTTSITSTTLPTSTTKQSDVDSEEGNDLNYLNSLDHQLSHLSWRQAALFWSPIFFMLVSFVLILGITCLFKSRISRRDNRNNYTIVESVPEPFSTVDSPCYHLHE